MIRTPLPPLQTFLEDPLRLLRTIRFKNRFDFTPVSELLEAAAHPDVKDGICQTLSYESIVIELDKMLRGSNAHKAIADLHKFNLLSILFKFPEDLLYF